MNPMKVHGGGGKAPLILKLGTRWSYRGFKQIRMMVVYIDREVKPLPASTQIASSELLKRFRSCIQATFNCWMCLLCTAHTIVHCTHCTHYGPAVDSASNR
jgi:hypothetical protein